MNKKGGVKGFRPLKKMKLLLHMCCAPCSIYPVNVLQEEGLDFQGYFYNPNIHPIDEFKRRKKTVEIYAELKGLKVFYEDDFKQDEWEKFSKSEAERCTMCYSLRMDKAARFAAQKGFDAFTTTLLISPYQKHDLIKKLGESSALKYGVNFYYHDFRPGFRQGQNEAREMQLYRQKFCGCIISFNESNMRKKKVK